MPTTTVRTPSGGFVKVRHPEGASQDEIIAYAKKGSAPDYITGAARAGLQGMTFGLSDEIGSLIAAFPASIQTGEKFWDVYDSMHDRLSEQRKAYAEKNPGTAFTAEMLGGIATGGAAGGRVLASKAVQGASKLGKAGATAGVGAVEGGIYGAGQADRGDRTGGAVTGAVVGGLGGPVAGAVANTIGRVGGTLSNRFADKMAKTPRGQAIQVLRNTADSIGMTADEAVESMGKMGKDAALVDLRDAFRVVGRAGMNKRGTMRQAGTDFVTDRQRKQQDRLMAAIQSVAGKSSAFRTTLAGITARRARASAPLYRKAEEAGLQMTPRLQMLMDDPLMKSAWREGEKWAQSTNGTVDLYNIAKQTKEALDGRIGMLLRAGNNPRARKLIERKRALLDEMTKQNDAYRQANQMYSSTSKLKDALELGRTIFKKDPDDIQELMMDMTEGEIELLRLGGVKAVGDILDGMGRSRDAMRKLTDSPLNEKRLALVLGDDAGAFLKRTGIEEQFTQTRNMLTGNSTTELQQQASRDLNYDIDSGLAEAIRSANPGNMLAKVVETLTSAKADPAIIDELGKLMFEQGMSPKQVRNIFASNAVRRVFGDDYERIVAPYVQSIMAPAIVGAQG